MNSLANRSSKTNNHTRNGFRNPFYGLKEINFTDFLKWKLVDSLKGEKPEKSKKYSFEIIDNNGRFLKQSKTDLTVTWIGHSTLLIQIQGLNILSDPIWSDRCSPLPFAGPRRYVDPSPDLQNLPKIDVVIISHDHYDHLDKSTIKKLGNFPFYFVPMGVGKILQKWSISNYK